MIVIAFLKARLHLTLLKDFQSRIIRNYIIGSFIAVFGVGSTFIFQTLDLSKSEIYLLLLIMVVFVEVMLIGEILVYKGHITSIKSALTQEHPPHSLIKEAYETAHRFPILTVKRIMGPHFFSSLPLSGGSVFIIMYTLDLNQGMVS